jgi:cytochrome c peroxidase
MRNRALARMGATIRITVLTLAVATGTFAFVSSDSAHEPNGAAPPLCSPQVDVLALRAHDPDLRQNNHVIDSTFAAAVAEAKSATPADRYGQITLLGKILLHDKNLSVNRDVACVTCHSDATGYTGPSEAINTTVVAYPSSVAGRIGSRKPQAYGYAAFAPILHYNATQADLYGGNFWDMRATGVRLTNPAAEQAQGPPLDPLEMALPDAACAVFRMSRGPYRAFFEHVWGAQSFAIRWPANADQVCSTPAPAPATDPHPVHLTATDRGIANSTYDDMALAMASFEASPEVSRFSSRFDSALAHPDEKILTPDEQAGWELFRGKAKCNSCHLDGADNRNGSRRSTPPDTPSAGDAADAAPLFTDFTSANLGVPRNPGLRYYCEDKPDKAGFTPNPKGSAFVDRGVGGFLRSTNNPASAWAGFASRFDGAVRVPTLRNVDMRPTPAFVKSYMHNGYFKSLEEVVHFYNTRDVLPRCSDIANGEKVNCWPAPEVAANMDTTMGHLGLTEHEEALIVSFLKTLTDRPLIAGPGRTRHR